MIEIKKIMNPNNILNRNLDSLLRLYIYECLTSFYLVSVRYMPSSP